MKTRKVIWLCCASLVINIPLGRAIKWPNTFELLLENARHQWQQRRLGCSTVRQFSLDENFQTPFIQSTPVSYMVACEAVFAINTWCHHRWVLEAQVFSCPCHLCATMPKTHKEDTTSETLVYDMVLEMGLVETHMWCVSPSKTCIGEHIYHIQLSKKHICGI